MEGIGEVNTNNIAGNSQLQGKGCDIPLKLESQNILRSPIECESLRIDWPGSSSVDYIDANRTEDNDSSRCVISLAGSEPDQTSPCSMNDVGNVVELTVRTFRTPDLSLGITPVNNRVGKWQHHESECPSGSKCETLDGAHDTKQIYACSRNSDERIMSSSTQPNVDASSKALASSSSSHLLVNKTLKRKEAVSKNGDALTVSVSKISGHVDEKLHYATKFGTGALMRSSASNNQLSLHNIGGSGPESLHHGIGLRAWMKLGFSRRRKDENLLIFRQIVELVDFAHSQGVVLQDLRPSSFKVLPSNRIVYAGSSAKRELGVTFFHDSVNKRPVEQGAQTCGNLVAKQQKLCEDLKSFRHQSQFASSCGFRTMAVNDIDFCAEDAHDSGNVICQSQSHSNHQNSFMKTRQQTLPLALQLEEKWYRSPEQPNEEFTTFSSNIYCLGVLLFELLSQFESDETHSTVMLDLSHRILPSNFLSENPKEAGFCLWFLHPVPSSRPTARQILQSELICQSQALNSGNDISACPVNTVDESELLLHFLNLLKEQKQMHASKLIEHIEWLEEDIKEIEKRHFLRISSFFSDSKVTFPDKREKASHYGAGSVAISKSPSVSNMKNMRLMRNINQINNAYFSMRSQICPISSVLRPDKDFLKNRARWSAVYNENEELSMIHKSSDPLGAFFEGLYKFARYSKLEVCGSLKNGDLLSSTNVLCTLSFDRDEEYLAAAGVSKKIKIFEFGALLNDSIDIHYPVVEMSNKSKLSCVTWNNYIKNYLASTDYDGVIQIWDAGTGQGFSQYTEHQKRAWSVDFSVVDPMMFASGSDDCSVKLWNINERGAIGTVWNPANICCVQFSASSTYMLAFGSADYKIYCYDLRHTRIPWCTLTGHEKAVSYVKFLDSETLVSASTDNTLKLWDLNKTNSTGLSSSACHLTFRGHTNEKNFVGLSTLDGYIACGSETNEVYCYYQSLPMPITSYKFGNDSPTSGNYTMDDSGQFVSSVCWRRKSNMVVAANSIGRMKVLRMV